MLPTRATTPDGLTLALHDLGGDGPPALVVHATGFHGRVFAPLAHRLGDRFHVLAPDLRGHGESGVPADLDFDWVGFGTDVLTAVDALELEGRSASAIPAVGPRCCLPNRPGRAPSRALYCFEPVVLPPDDPTSPELSSSLAKASRQRREIFGSRREAYDNYASKLPLSVLDPEPSPPMSTSASKICPTARSGFAVRGEHEALIFENGLRPSRLLPPRHGRMPGAVACGSESDSFTPAALSRWQNALRSGASRCSPGSGTSGLSSSPPLWPRR